jgi:hypothetical protein
MLFVGDDRVVDRHDVEVVGEAVRRPVRNADAVGR